jgi:hypothetical protein
MFMYYGPNIEKFCMFGTAQPCVRLCVSFVAVLFSFQFPLVLLIAIAMFFANVVTPSGKYSNTVESPFYTLEEAK